MLLFHFCLAFMIVSQEFQLIIYPNGTVMFDALRVSINLTAVNPTFCPKYVTHYRSKGNSSSELDMNDLDPEVFPHFKSNLQLLLNESFSVYPNIAEIYAVTLWNDDQVCCNNW